MKLTRILLFILAILVLYAGYVAVSLATLPSVETLKNRKMNMTIRVKDWKGNEHLFVVGPKNRDWTPSSKSPPEMKWAVILAEDARFYKHEGIDVKAIKNAIKYDLEKKSFSRGASTITQQVAKNLFLSREKTITRKIEEVYLAKRMEEVLTKGRIIELYLNVVELGPMVYGIGHGARYYFGKPASALNPRECAFLAAMLPGPRIAYNPYKNLSKVLKRSDMILKLMRRKGVLNDGEYHAALAEQPNINGLQRKVEETIQKEPVFTDMTSAYNPVPEIPATGSGENGQGDEAPPSMTSGKPANPDGADSTESVPQDRQPSENPQPGEQ